MSGQQSLVRMYCAGLCCAVLCCAAGSLRTVTHVPGWLTAVSHVREEGVAGRWWRFDDGEVKLMEGGPLGEHGDHGIQSAATKEKRVRMHSLLAAGQVLLSAPS